MAQLAAEIDATTVIYGSAEQRRHYAEKTAAVTSAAPAAAKADRGAYYAKGGGVAAAPAEDVVGGVAQGTMDIDGLDEGMLPDDMHGKSKTEIEADLKARATKRAEAQKEIADLAKKRDEYIKANQKDASSGFDNVVKETLTTELK